MKRAMASVMLVAAAAMAGCEHSTSAVYDPNYDGVTPLEHPHPDLSILENQKQLYDKLAAATPGGGAHNATAPAGNAPGAGQPSAPATPPPPPPG